MKKLRAFYFSGTGNTRYVTRDLCKKLSEGFDALAFDISGTGELSAELRAADCVLLAFPDRRLPFPCAVSYMTMRTYGRERK